MARTITGQEGNINVFASGSGQAAGINAIAGIGDEFLVLKEVYSSDAFTVTDAMDGMIFMGFGGGGNGNAGFCGGGGGFFQKAIAAPAPGTTFTLQIGGIGGTTYLRDADGNIICEATGGTAATEGAHGLGGTASGGDISSKGAPGTGDGGGAAGSPFGNSVGTSMYMIYEYARSCRDYGRIKAFAYGGTLSPADLGNNGSNPTSGPTSGGNGGFGGAGGNGGAGNGTATSGGYGGSGGFGGGGGNGGRSGSGSSTVCGKGGNGGFGGGGGNAGPIIGSGLPATGGNGGFGGGGGNGGGSGSGGSGGAGAILVLIRLKHGLTALHNM